MSNEKIVDTMISFVEEIEKDLQASKMASDSKSSSRTEVVNTILDKLDEEYNNENKND